MTAPTTYATPRGPAALRPVGPRPIAAAVASDGATDREPAAEVAGDGRGERLAPVGGPRRWLGDALRWSCNLWLPPAHRLRSRNPEAAACQAADPESLRAQVLAGIVLALLACGATWVLGTAIAGAFELGVVNVGTNLVAVAAGVGLRRGWSFDLVASILVALAWFAIASIMWVSPDLMLGCLFALAIPLVLAATLGTLWTAVTCYVVTMALAGWMVATQLDAAMVPRAMSLDLVGLLTFFGLAVTLATLWLVAHVTTGMKRRALAQTERANRSLDVALRRAEASSRAKGAFLSQMSHELRTPMNGIMGMADLLKGTRVDDEQREYLDALHLSADNLLGLLDDVLLVAGREGDADAPPAPLDPRALVSAVEALTAPSLRATGARLDVSVAPNVAPRYVGDARQLQRSWLALVGHAIATAHGDVVAFSLEVEPADDGRVTLVARVAGRGRVDTDRPSPRSGRAAIELAVAAEICARMGGALCGGDEPGAPATARVPVRRHDEVTAREAECATVPGARILVAHGHPIEQLRLTRLLTRGGFEVVSATGRADAASLLDRERVDAALVEITSADDATATPLRGDDGQRVPTIGLRHPATTLPCSDLGGVDRCLPPDADAGTIVRALTACLPPPRPIA